MTAIVLRQSPAVAASTTKQPLEVMFKCADGIVLRVPAHTVFRHLRPDAGVAESDGPRKIRKLLRELIALSKTKKK